MPVNRNAESYFALNPQVHIGRSRFDLSHGYLTTFNVGQLIPFEVREVVAGDTFQVKTHKVIRMQPMVTSPFDVIECDTYYFYVPMRIIWDHWPEFLGATANTAPWYDSTEYTIPQIIFPSQADESTNVGGAIPGSVLDYMGLPLSESGDGYSVSALPLRAYCAIVNEFFRDENLENPIYYPTDDSNVTALGNKQDSRYNDPTNGLYLGGAPFIANKLSDYFTRALPAPQRGPAVNVLPSSYVYFGEDRDKTGLSAVVPKIFKNQGGSLGDATGVNLNYMDTPSTNYATQPANWMVENPTINQLRIAFQVQKYYEALARSGNRYRELIRGIWGVSISDSTVQIPQYLGGARTTLSSNQVIQTSETSATPQGNVAGYVLKSDSHGDFIQSFEEAGYIIGVMTCRYHHSYQNGVQRFWSRKDRFDFYTPQFASVGEQPILNKEIFVSGNTSDDEVFGYNEAWADYRTAQSIFTGEMRSNIPTTLDSWHFGDRYQSTPLLGDSWIKEDKSNVDRALAVNSSVSNQIFADLWIEMLATRPLPVHSIPGLVDHF